MPKNKIAKIIFRGIDEQILNLKLYKELPSNSLSKENMENDIEKLEHARYVLSGEKLSEFNQLIAHE